jgi:hypothetical protein
MDSKHNNLSNVGGSMLINSGESMLKTAIASTSSLTAIQTPPTNKKLDLSTISQEDNTRHHMQPPPPSPHYHNLKQQNNCLNENNIQQDDNQRNARRSSPIYSTTTTLMARSQSLTNTNIQQQQQQQQQQRILNPETAEAIAVSTKNGILSSIKALSKESLNSSTHLMEPQEFYQLASQITNNSNSKGHEDSMQRAAENNDGLITKKQTLSKETKKEKKTTVPNSCLNEDKETKANQNNTQVKTTSNRMKSNSISIENSNFSTNQLPPQPPVSSHTHNHHLHSPPLAHGPLIPLNNLKQQQQHQRNNHNSEILNGGSVKSLVQSYEEFPHKEVSIDSKIIQMREERQKELESVVEQSRIALNSELLVENCADNEADNTNQGY